LAVTFPVELVVNSITGIWNQLKINASPLVPVSNLLVTNNQILLLDDSTQSVLDNVVAGISISSSSINNPSN